LVSTYRGKESMIRLYVFDMAGTTIDEQNVVYKTIRQAIIAAGIDVSQETVQAEGAGKEKSQAIRDILAALQLPPDESQVQSIFSDFKSRLVEAYKQLDVAEQQGASNILSGLRERGCKVVLNTGYDRKTAESLLDKLAWSQPEMYDALVTASDVERGRPHPDMIYLAMQQTGIKDAAEVAKIGDSTVDILEGKNANCGLTVGVTTGAQTRDQLATAGPDLIVDTLAELLPQ